MRLVRFCFGVLLSESVVHFAKAPKKRKPLAEAALNCHLPPTKVKILGWFSMVHLAMQKLDGKAFFF